MMPEIKIKLANTLCAPVRAHPSDAGADLKTIDSHVLDPGTAFLYNTGVSIRIPEGFVGLVFNRSSQGKLGIKLANSVGVIDSDYRGEIKVLLENTSKTHTFSPVALETKIAQLVIVPIILPRFVEYTGDDWNNTTRGIGGFGSTG